MVPVIIGLVYLIVAIALTWWAFTDQESSSQY